MNKRDSMIDKQLNTPNGFDYSNSNNLLYLNSRISANYDKARETFIQ